MTKHRKTIAQLATDAIAEAIWTQPDDAGWAYAKLPWAHQESVHRAVERLLVKYAASRTPLEELATAIIAAIHTEPTVGNILSNRAQASVVRLLEEWAPTVQPNTTSAEILAAREAKSCP